MSSDTTAVIRPGILKKKRSTISSPTDLGKRLLWATKNHHFLHAFSGSSATFCGCYFMVILMPLELTRRI